MLHSYLLVNTLQMHTLNSAYSPIKRRIPDKLGPCLNFFLKCIGYTDQFFPFVYILHCRLLNSGYFFKLPTPALYESTVLLKFMRTNFFVVTYSLTKICQNLQYLITVNFATAIPLACALNLKINSAYHIMVYFQGVQRSIPGPQILLGPPNLIGAHAVKSFFVR